MKAKDKQVRHRQIIKEPENLSISNKKGELNVSDTQLNEAELVLKCLFYVEDTSTTKSQPSEHRNRCSYVSKENTIANKSSTIVDPLQREVEVTIPLSFTLLTSFTQLLQLKLKGLFLVGSVMMLEELHVMPF